MASREALLAPVMLRVGTYPELMSLSPSLSPSSFICLNCGLEITAYQVTLFFFLEIFRAHTRARDNLHGVTPTRVCLSLENHSGGWGMNLGGAIPYLNIFTWHIRYTQKAVLQSNFDCADRISGGLLEHDGLHTCLTRGFDETDHIV